MKGFLIILLFVLIIILIIYKSNIIIKKEDSQNKEQIFAKIDQTNLTIKIRNITNAINQYFAHHGEFPEILDILVPHYLKTERDLLDPWGTKFEIKIDEEMNLVLISAGQDQVFGNSDDIRRRL